MNLAILLATLCFASTAALHLGVLHRLSRIMGSSRTARPALWIGTFLVIGLLHMIEAGIYTAAFRTGQAFGIGGFASTGGNGSWMETYYFALVSYTSLGLGDIYPTDHLRLIAGVASLNGFLLISCSAALLFRMVSHPIAPPESADHRSSAVTSRPAPSIPGRKRRDPAT